MNISKFKFYTGGVSKTPKIKISEKFPNLLIYVQDNQPFHLTPSKKQYKIVVTGERKECDQCVEELKSLVDSVVIHYLKILDTKKITINFKWKMRDELEVNIDFNNSRKKNVTLTAIGPDAKKRID